MNLKCLSNNRPLSSGVDLTGTLKPGVPSRTDGQGKEKAKKRNVTEKDKEEDRTEKVEWWVVFGFFEGVGSMKREREQKKNRKKQ